MAAEIIVNYSDPAIARYCYILKDSEGSTIHDFVGRPDQFVLPSLADLLYYLAFNNGDIHLYINPEDFFNGLYAELIRMLGEESDN